MQPVKSSSDAENDLEAHLKRIGHRLDPSPVDYCLWSATGWLSQAGPPGCAHCKAGDIVDPYPYPCPSKLARSTLDSCHWICPGCCKCCDHNRDHKAHFLRLGLYPCPGNSAFQSPRVPTIQPAAWGLWHLDSSADLLERVQPRVYAPLKLQDLYPLCQSCAASHRRSLCDRPTCDSLV